MPFVLPSESNQTITLGASTPTIDPATVSWAGLRSNGLDGQIAAHLAGLDQSPAEDAETQQVVRALMIQLARNGPVHLTRASLDYYLSGEPMQTLDLVTRLARVAYGLATIAGALTEVATFLGQNGDSLPVVVPAWSHEFIPENPQTQYGPRRQIPQS